ncbi:MAG: RNase H-like domain-containing protein, partial [Aeromonas sp.]
MRCSACPGLPPYLHIDPSTAPSTFSQALLHQKSCLVSAPVLSVPDPSLQFIVEVNASVVGVGAVLSQCSAGDGKVHPYSFFFHRFHRTACSGGRAYRDRVSPPTYICG